MQGPTFLIEYDNTQNDGNHIHAVWRDFQGDFGRDVLREHVRADHAAVAVALTAMRRHAFREPRYDAFALCWEFSLVAGSSGVRARAARARAVRATPRRTRHAAARSGRRVVGPRDASWPADDMRGRETGSPEHRKAANYVADQLARAGVQPAGTNGFLQPVTFRSRKIDEAKSSLALVRRGKETPLVLGDDASFGMRIDPAPTVEAPLVFAGHGLVIPEVEHDDFAGLDVKGKVVVYLAGSPDATCPAPSARTTSRRRNAGPR